jgi:hypothetical protein
MKSFAAGFVHFWLLAALLFALPSAGAQVAAIQGEGAQLLEPLSACAGKVLPSASFPYSGSFLLDSATALGQRSAGEAGTQLESFASDLASRDVTALHAGLSVVSEWYLRPDIPLAYADYLELVDPLFTFQLSFQLDLSAAIFIEAIGIREYRLGMSHDNWFEYESDNPMTIENNLVRQGYLYLAGGPAELTLGRQHVSLGPSPFTSIAVSPEVPFLDALNLKLHLGRLHMTLLLSSLENRRATGDVTLPVGSDYAFEKTVILYNTHYFEYDFGFLRAGIGSSVLITRPQNAFQVSDFFPVFSWHNANIKPNNLSLFFDLSAVPFHGIELYGQFGFDDINANTFSSNDSGIPTIGAGLCGAGWRGGWERVRISASVEVGATHYLWGSFNDSVPLARAIYRMDLDENNRWIPLTSPFGPGAFWLLAELSVGLPWQVASTLSFQMVSRNTAASLTGAYEADLDVKHAPRSLSLRAGLELTYEPFRWIHATIEPVLRFDGGDPWVELHLGIGTRMEKERLLNEPRR